MKKLFEILSPDEKAQVEKSLDATTAPTPRAREKTQNVRRIVEERCVVDPEAEARWSASTERVRQKVLAETIWRLGCIIEGSSTAVMGLDSFSMGHGFKLAHRKLDAGAAFILF